MPTGEIAMTAPAQQSSSTAAAAKILAAPFRDPNPTMPVPPPMQVVTKGWWVLREEQVSADDLIRQDAAQERVG